jgi:hypothetical protein
MLPDHLTAKADGIIMAWEMLRERAKSKNILAAQLRGNEYRGAESNKPAQLQAG